MSIELVILDCDGVLVDSERITTVLLAEVVSELGWAVSREDSISLFKGKDMKIIRAMVEERLERSVGDDFVPGYRRRMAERFATQGVPAIAGAGDLLDWLDARRIAHVVASNGPHEKMKQTLGRLRCNGDTRDWYARFEGRCHSAYDINCWKPDPGLFLHAAEVMQARPERCVVIEDSCSGVAAAQAAGMRSIGYADLTSAEELRAAGATVVADSMHEVQRVLEGWSGGRGGSPR